MKKIILLILAFSFINSSAHAVEFWEGVENGSSGLLGAIAVGISHEFAHHLTARAYGVDIEWRNNPLFGKKGMPMHFIYVLPEDIPDYKKRRICLAGYISDISWATYLLSDDKWKNSSFSTGAMMWAIFYPIFNVAINGKHNEIHSNGEYTDFYGIEKSGGNTKLIGGIIISATILNCIQIKYPMSTWEIYPIIGFDYRGVAVTVKF
ncbi:MAG: hypothetical protein KAR54_03260 [Candidatus Pacebacteria bacterium]|nr:hypothetical protein [Candidatus Paceibacterota bacterium]